MTDGVRLAAARRFRVAAAFRPAARRFRVVAALLPAARRFRVTAAFFAAADDAIPHLLVARFAAVRRTARPIRVQPGDAHLDAAHVAALLEDQPFAAAAVRLLSQASPAQRTVARLVNAPQRDVHVGNPDLDPGIRMVAEGVQAPFSTDAKWLAPGPELNIDLRRRDERRQRDQKRHGQGTDREPTAKTLHWWMT
jgi:hypothetical protein